MDMAKAEWLKGLRGKKLRKGSSLSRRTIGKIKTETRCRSFSIGENISFSELCGSLVLNHDSVLRRGIGNGVGFEVAAPVALDDDAFVRKVVKAVALRAAGIGQGEVKREALGERGGVVARGAGEVVGHDARLPVHIHPGRHADDEAGNELRLAVGIECGARIGSALAVGRGEYIILCRECDGAEHAGAGKRRKQLRRTSDGRKAHESAIV